MRKVLDEWEENTIKPLLLKNEPANVINLVDLLPMKTITAVFFGYDFVARHENKINR